MPSRSSNVRGTRIATVLRGRLTFANTISVVALFVALGGSSYAAFRVDSGDIANNSVRSEDLRNNDVHGRDIAKDTIRGTDVRDNDLQGRDLRDNTLSGNDVKESSLAMVPNSANAANAASAQTLGGKAPSAFLGSDEQVRTGLVKLAHGETTTVAASGPFTWRAHCTDDGGGSTRLKVTLESTEPDSFAGDFATGGQAAAPGSPATLFDNASSTPGYTIGFPLSATAPSGAAPVGLAFVGLKVAGTDCAVNGVLWP